MRTSDSEPTSSPPLSPLSDFSTLSSSLDALTQSISDVSTLSSGDGPVRGARTGSISSDGSDVVVVSRSELLGTVRGARTGSFSSDGSSCIIVSHGRRESTDEEDDDEVIVHAPAHIVTRQSQTLSQPHLSRGNPALKSATPIAEVNEADSDSDSDPGSGRSTPTMSCKLTSDSGSIISAEDAQSSLDEFLLAPGRYLDRAGKLRVWQSLCYELGLAYFPHEPPSIPGLSSPSSSRSTTPTQDHPHPGPIPMPQSLTKCEALLKARGHVNIHDYFRERDTDRKERPDAVAGCGAYEHLVYPSTKAMTKYTRKQRKFAPLKQVKAEALQPLLRDFGFKRRYK